MHISQGDVDKAHKLAIALAHVSVSHLYSLQVEIQVEVQQWEVIVHDELLTVKADRDSLRNECAHLRREKEEMAQEVVWLGEVVSTVFSTFSKVPLLEDQLVEEQLGKILEVLQQLKGRISELEAVVVPTTSPEVGETRQQEANDEIVHLEVLEVQCTVAYKKAEQIWNDLVENATLKSVEKDA